MSEEPIKRYEIQFLYEEVNQWVRWTRYKTGRSAYDALRDIRKGAQYKYRIKIIGK